MVLKVVHNMNSTIVYKKTTRTTCRRLECGYLCCGV